MLSVSFRAPEVSDEVKLGYAQRVMAREDFTFAFDFPPNDSFPNWLAKLNDRRLGIGLLEWQVPSTFELAIVDARIAGRLSVRHSLNAQLLQKGGHVGYAVLPKFRQQGIGHRMMQRSLEITASLGIARVLVTCDETNVASRRIIESAGRIFESHHVGQSGDVPTRRYWIE